MEIKWADNPEKWAEFCGLDNAYHGMVFAEALAQMGNNRLPDLCAYALVARRRRVYESICGVSIFTGH